MSCAFVAFSQVLLTLARVLNLPCAAFAHASLAQHSSAHKQLSDSYSALGVAGTAFLYPADDCAPDSLRSICDSLSSSLHALTLAVQTNGAPADLHTCLADMHACAHDCRNLVRFSDSHESSVPRASVFNLLSTAMWGHQLAKVLQHPLSDYA